MWGGEFAGESPDAVGQVAVVKQVVDRLHNNGPVHARGGHGLEEQLDGAWLAGFTRPERVFFRVITPHVEVGIDNHV